MAKDVIMREMGGNHPQPIVDKWYFHILRRQRQGTKSSASSVFVFWSLQLRRSTA